MVEIAPAGWGKDKLSGYLDAVRNNYFAGFSSYRHRYGQLSEIDDCFVRILDGWINPPNAVASSLFYRSHSAFRTASGQVLAGQLTESYAVMRLCLEFAGYGLLMLSEPRLGTVWLNRHRDAVSKRAAINEFALSNVRTAIKACDEALASVYDLLYERAIDFGAHPNERSVTGAMDIIEEADQSRFVHTHLAGPGTALEHGLKTLAQTGVCALHLFQHAAKARFELLGVKHRLQVLRKQDL